ncbi:MAG TPA: membrane-bound lytic murein transglycosylase MltF [Steroidobacteraceae bacterium]|jgi:membrane-bound lytic murein transglycosylase F|nr:membrane-bound lytic murein transglycosylase MltF [Steroidobacteraceae bacterium]
MQTATSKTAAGVIVTRPSPPRRSSITRCARRLAVGTSCALLLASCGHSQGALAQIRARGKLRVVTLNTPTSYYLGAHGPQGLEYRLVSAFAQQLGVGLQVEAVLDEAAMRASLSQGRADLAAAQISADARWRGAGVATHSYEQVAQLVVQGRGRPRARDVTDLVASRVAVRAGSPQARLLQTIRGEGVPRLSWIEQSTVQPDPLELVERGDADFAVVDANEFAFAQHLYPDVSVAFTLPDARPVQWIVRADGDDLAAAADRFFAAAGASGQIARIEQAARAESDEFDYLEARRFQLDIATRLPQLQELFQQAAKATGIDWRLLAAVGYQESRWQMQAVSDDGAQGIMMLTPDAASAIGVTDRTNLSQNILGGARYLAQVLRTIPKHVPEPDRTWLALAAYNVGYGHLEDARVLAQQLGKDPDSWSDVRAELPLLAQVQWYSHARRGYARGWEPAKFVQQVRQYLAVLEWFDTTPLSMRTPQRVLREALSATPPQYN